MTYLVTMTLIAVAAVAFGADTSEVVHGLVNALLGYAVGRLSKQKESDE